MSQDAGMNAGDSVADMFLSPFLKDLIAAGATNYRVEFKDALSDPNWTYLKSVQNNANDRQEISVSDSLTGDNQGRFYRVTYQP